MRTVSLRRRQTKQTTKLQRIILFFFCTTAQRALLWSRPLNNVPFVCFRLMFFWCLHLSFAIYTYKRSIKLNFKKKRKETGAHQLPNYVCYLSLSFLGYFNSMPKLLKYFYYLFINCRSISGDGLNIVRLIINLIYNKQLRMRNSELKCVTEHTRNSIETTWEYRHGVHK